MLRRLLVCSFLLCLAAPVPAQQPEMPKPGPEHEILKKQVGTWDATMRMKMMPGDHKATAKYEMLGGFWLMGTFEGSMGEMKFTGKEVTGYDPLKKKYVGTWIDSLSPHMIVMESTYDAGSKTFTSTGDGVGMDGKPIKIKGVLTWKDDDTFTFTMHEGPDVNSLQEHFSIEYKRRK
jgi:hypothetical protein